MEIAEFYDLRGESALKRDNRKYGAAEVPEYLRGPYLYVERELQMAHALGATSLLDLCCGTGTHSVGAAALGYSVVGLDLSERSIAAATSLAKKNGVESRTQFIVRSFESFAQESTLKFDVILVSGSLYYLDLDTFLRMSKKLLNKGGWLVCVETYGGNPFMRVVRRMRSRFYKNRDEKTLIGLLGKNEIQRVLHRFPQGRVRYFNFFTLLGALSNSESRGAGFLLRLARWIDDLLLNRLGLSFLSFNFTFVGRNY